MLEDVVVPVPQLLGTCQELTRLFPGAALHWGRVRTTDVVTFYKKIQVQDSREIGVFPLEARAIRQYR